MSLAKTVSGKSNKTKPRTIPPYFDGLSRLIRAEAAAGLRRGDKRTMNQFGLIELEYYISVFGGLS